MVENDTHYFNNVLASGLLRGPLLEVGAAKIPGNTLPNICEMAERFGIHPTLGVDLALGEGVDVTFDFSIPCSEFAAGWRYGWFNSVVIFNVLEHTFDPAMVLRNALSCLNPGGALVVVAPSVWSIHAYPRDFLRLLPDWFVEFGKQNGLTIIEGLFCFISPFGINRVNIFGDEGKRELPNYLNAGRIQYPFRYWTSRIVHKLFNTFGRSHPFTHAAIGAVFNKPPEK